MELCMVLDYHISGLEPNSLWHWLSKQTNSKDLVGWQGKYMESRYIPILFSTQSLKKVSGQTQGQGGSCGGSSRYIRPTRSHILSTACIRIWIRARKNVSESVLLLSFFFDRAQYHSYSIEMICSVYIYVRVQFEQELVQGLWRTNPWLEKRGNNAVERAGGERDIILLMNCSQSWTILESGTEYQRIRVNYAHHWTRVEKNTKEQWWTLNTEQCCRMENNGQYRGSPSSYDLPLWMFLDKNCPCEYSGEQKHKQNPGHHRQATF